MYFGSSNSSNIANVFDGLKWLLVLASIGVIALLACAGLGAYWLWTTFDIVVQ